MKIGRNIVLFVAVILFSQCNYKSPEKDPEQEVSYFLQKVYNLPYDVNESSGIIVYDSLLWTFNDGRNDPILYGLNLSTGIIKKTLHLSGADNVDWEDIAQDSSFIYIGDFGNNDGSRQDLCIYRFSKNDIEKESGEQEIPSEKINFFFQDQEDFTNNNRNTPFDCEAFLFDGDSLILFTKDWVDQRSTVYKLPILPGTYQAERCFKMESEGLITGADINLQSNTLMLCGYRYFIPFVLVKENYRGKNLLEFNMKRIDLFDDYGIQLEGIACYNDVINLSSENSADIQALYHLVEQ
jgi:hypothetical protein